MENAKVLVVGAGSMGLATGYHLSLAGAEVTFLVRPHRLPELSRPQILYSYDDNTLRTFSDYSIIDTPTRIASERYDYIVITLDGAALRASAGVEVVRQIGLAAKDQHSGIVLGTIGTSLRDWFLEQSGLPGDQVTNGALGIQCYPVAAANLPLHSPTDPKLLHQADLAYRHCWPFGFIVDQSSETVARGFAELYARSGESSCVIQTPLEFAVGITPLFAMLAACELLDWSPTTRINPASPEWELGVEATREIQGLGIHGAVGQKARQATTAQGLVEIWRTWEQDMLPLDLQEFGRYHHGGKVNVQDRLILQDCLAKGAAEGREMPFLTNLIARLAVISR
ncbi:ketopantoate reductase family protein [Rhizobium sp. Rhizsp42]|uniref:ketopantoate reductase family protein n=1 Tax=Rhizobium sp. Rhizsp42 TaxID=3243034 RepID=UPI0039B00CB0